MKNLLIIILSISTLALGFLQIRACNPKEQAQRKNPMISLKEAIASNEGASAYAASNFLVIDFDALPPVPPTTEAKFIELDSAKAVINSNIPLIGTPATRDSEYTRSVFFTLLELFTLLRDGYFGGTPTQEQLLELGVRVYLGKYDNDDRAIRAHLGSNLPDYQDRPTAMLQLMNYGNTTFLKRKGTNKYWTVNLGQLCPPKCPITDPVHDVFFVPGFMPRT